MQSVCELNWWWDLPFCVFRVGSWWQACLEETPISFDSMSTSTAPWKPSLVCQSRYCHIGTVAVATMSENPVSLGAAAASTEHQTNLPVYFCHSFGDELNIQTDLDTWNISCVVEKKAWQLGVQVPGQGWINKHKLTWFVKVVSLWTKTRQFL